MSVAQKIVTQFKQPHGLIGKIAGYIMANRPSNILRNEWTLSLLDLQPADKILEVGFGPGIAIEKAAGIVKDGSIVGIDHSETMLHQAGKRNALAIQQGQVILKLGTIDSLSAFKNSFDKIYSANVVQFWDDPKREFQQLFDLLVPGGIIATTYMPRHKGASSEDGRKKAVEIEQCLKAVGFRNIRIEEKHLDPVSVVCVLTEKRLG